MTHLSTLALHQLRYGELSREETEQARAHLDDCTACTQRMQAQHAMRAEFEVLPIPPAIRQPQPRTASRWWWVIPALTAAMVAVMVVPPTDAPTDPIEEIRYKSAGDAVELLLEGHGVIAADEARLHRGDRLQIRIAPSPYQHAWVSDGKQMLGSFDLEAGRATLAPFSLEIDGSPGTEQLVVVLSYGPLRRAQITQALMGQSVPGTEVFEMELQKAL